MTATATVVLLDTSNSMAEPFNSEFSKWQFAYDRIQEHLPRFASQGVPVGIKQFLPGDKIDTPLKLGVHPVAEVEAAIKRIVKPVGGTPLAQGIISAADELSSYSMLGGSIVTFSDGGHHTELPSSITMEDAYRVVSTMDAKSANRTRLFFMALAQFPTRAIEELNKRFAITGGGFYSLTTQTAHSDAVRVASNVLQMARADESYAALLDQLAQLNERMLSADFERRRPKADFDHFEVTSHNVVDSLPPSAMRELELTSPGLAKAIGQLQYREKVRLRSRSLFRTTFGWTVAGGFIAILGLVIALTYSLRSADEMIVKEVNQDLDHVTTVVDKLWEIWGR